MSVIHQHTLRTSVPPSHVQLACDGVYLALPYGRKSVGVWSLQDVTCKPLELVGHSRAVYALCFSHRQQPTLLCSAADDYVIIWNIEKARAALESGQQIRGQVIGTTLGQVEYLAFNPENSMVAACVGSVVILLESMEEKHVATLEGHIGQVNCAEFCPHYTSTLVTAGDDRTFKVWDICSCSLLYQSTIISPSPFLSLTMNPVQENFALGSSDGQVRVYDMTDGNGFRCLHQMDVSKLVSKLKEAKESSNKQFNQEPKGPVTISSRPSWQRSLDSANNSEDVPSSDEDSSEAGCSILGMGYSYSRSTNTSRQPSAPPNLPFLQRNHSLLNELFENSPMLLIGSTSALVQVNARTLEPCAYASLQDRVSSSSLLETSDKTLCLAGTVAFVQHALQDKVTCVIGSLFQNEVHILQVDHPSEEDANRLKHSLSSVRLSASFSQCQVGEADRCSSLPGADSEDQTDSDLISVLSSGPLLPNSPLKAEMVLKAKPTSSNKKPVRGPQKQPPGVLNKKGQIVDNQPIVFHTKVKSSGYTKESPRKKMFQPQLNSPSKSQSSSRTSSRASQPRTVSREYPVDGDAPTQLLSKLDVAERPTAITCVRFSDDGQHLACALANTTAQLFRVPLSGKGRAFAGHSGSVTSVSWSHDNKWLLTSSDDRTASVWSLGMADPVMTFSTSCNNFGADKEGGLKPSKDNPSFSKAVKFGQFYYMDKFILLSSGSAFHLYKYHLDTAKSDIKRYLSNNRFKLVKSFSLEQAQQITAFSAVNGFYSYIALCAGSNKSIEVFDLNKGQSVRVMPDVHTKAVHTIQQNEGSAYVSHGSSAYDLFLTAAAGDCIKLWDLRSNRCVRRYEGHNNRIHPCGVALSPCSRFIATGSEDRSAYIFDVRSGTYLHKLTGHTETVGDVAFHPLYPQLVTASLDGKIRLFT